MGSSPLARGKPPRTRVYHTSTRLIPARAGKTWFVVSTANHPWAHPRSRGENYSFRFGLVRFGGSSPLARGKLPWAYRGF